MNGNRHRHGIEDTLLSEGQPLPNLVAGRALDLDREDARTLVEQVISIDDQGEDGDSSIPAGYTYLGQLIAHDLSFTPRPLGPLPASAGRPEEDQERQGGRQTAQQDRSFRTPALDLDCLYGRGPRLDAHLYDGNPTRHEDVPLAGLLFPEGQARPQSNNPAEPDLPRRTFPVVFPSSEGRVSARGLQGEVQLVDVLESDIVEKKEGARKIHFVPLRSGFRFRGRDEDGRIRWFNASPTVVSTMASSAVIADVRNDDNFIVSQIHLALARFHNKVLRGLHHKSPNASLRSLFRDARRMVLWHYQWIVAEDFRPRLTGIDSSNDSWRKLLGSIRQPVSVEFASGAFRCGHAMVRDEYVLNEQLPGPIRFLDDGPMNDLRGGRVQPSRWAIDWGLFLDEDRAQKARRINTKISSSVDKVRQPFDDPRERLLVLDVMRAKSLGAVSGQAVASFVKKQTGAQIKRLEPLMDDGDPLPLYFLREAEKTKKGTLGPIGARLVSDTLLAILHQAPKSYVHEPGWDPRKNGYFNDDEPPFLQLIRLAGLPATAEEHERFLREPLTDAGLEPPEDLGFHATGSSTD